MRFSEIRSRFSKQMLLFFAIVFIVVILAGIYGPRPRNDRDWETEFAVPVEVVMDGQKVSLKNVRDWKYSETDILSKEIVDRVVPIQDVKQVWFLLEPFSSVEAVAHTYFTFDIKNQEPISFSIEARRERNEQYSGTAGLLNRFELIYTWGTETDFLTRRVKYLKNPVYMIPLTLSEKQSQDLFVILAKSTQELNDSPRFYNTFDTNCTNTLADEVNKVTPGAVPWDLARYLTGYSGEFLANKGYFRGVKNWDEDKQHFLTNQYMDSILDDVNLSRQLREKLSK